MRCTWADQTEPLYVKYHDEEWGRPTFQDEKLFEMLCLEGAQAGLSWITILKKREHYREFFDQFDATIMAAYDEQKVEQLINEPRIIRNRLKINAFIENAKAYLKIKQQNESFAHYIWSFVDGKTIQNQWQTHSEIPSQTAISIQMSKQLKKDGFKFVGPTICYAFMQAVGMVNDHVVNCICYKEIKESVDQL
jgi:DNA-3-methyladenine glycosylase I